ncbi:MAG: sulfatase [Myxococcales bacterium]|nr:sulfatase [Myxococcales bacterium]
MNAKRVLLLLACLGLIVVGLARTLEFRRPDRPEGGLADLQALPERDDLNLIVVLIDTLRADRLSAYGYERPTSPILDAIAASGVRFENTLAQSTWTKTSMASMLTATYPVRNGITRFNHGVPDSATLPSEFLQRAGFRTVGIWRNGWVAPNFGFEQGFDVYVKPAPLGRNPELNPSASRLAGTDREVVDAATQFLRTNRDQRFYLYLHLMDVHQYVYDGSVEFGTTYSDIYDQSIRFVDATLGNLVAVLQQEGLMKKTVIAFVSDHGEAFLEHGDEGHARTLYDETTRVPFILALPFRLETPIVVETPVENVDLFPTLFDLLGLPPMPDADGVSLVPLIEAAAKGDEASVAATFAEPARFAELDQAWGRPSIEPVPLTLIHDGRYRLHNFRGAAPKLFDYEVDPGEQVDIGPEHPEIVTELRKKLRAHTTAEQVPWGGPEQVTVSEMEAAHLRALGYVVDPHAPPGKGELKR